ncbi:AraC family transcriptional regulator [Anaerosporobacter sp.]|uniref:AraC family transcriptional regulator n=1 Tax=Anaerosporobacter sp. TaxID=1872529 RepID=UPI00286F3C83|nr:AraC family transcriptional regulator [Anaerosporobacter sp.]
MEWIKLLQKAITYMEEHILENINYEDVAATVCMSSYNFHRTFSIMTDMTANTYIRNRRLSLAGQELQTSDISVIDVAYKYGYETPESFSKAFSRFHGVTPKQAKVKGTQLRLFNPLVIKITLEGGNIMDYRIEKRGKQKFIAKVRAFSNEIMNDESDHSIPDFWKECNEKNSVEAIRNLRPEGKRDLYGLCSPTKKDSVTFDYGIGVIIDEETNVDDLDVLLTQGFSLWETEPIEYAVFKCMGTDGDCISQMWSYFFKEFIPNTKYNQTEDTDYEIYFEKSEAGMFCELWIPVVS